MARACRPAEICTAAYKGTNVPFCGVPAGTEDDRLRACMMAMFALLFALCGTSVATAAAAAALPPLYV
eukprot:COSAG01_NODE_17619_length_1136_cov_2.140791_2_plen_67_part_01